MALPLDRAYLTAIWLETLFYGACVSGRFFETRPHLPDNPRHQLYPLLDLWLCSHQDEDEDSMDYAGSCHLPMDAFHCARVPRLYSAYMLLPLPLYHEYPLLPAQRLVYGFIYNRDKPGGPAAYFSDISIPGNVAKVFIHTLNVSFLIGRLPRRAPRAHR